MTRRPNVCLIPEPVSGQEAAIYEGIRSTIVRAHCAADRPAHLCCGRVTIDRSTITLNCPLCGDARHMLNEGKTDHDERT